VCTRVLEFLALDRETKPILLLSSTFKVACTRIPVLFASLLRFSAFYVLSLYNPYNPYNPHNPFIFSSPPRNLVRTYICFPRWILDDYLPRFPGWSL
jgi:hypothetical protein